MSIYSKLIENTFVFAVGSLLSRSVSFFLLPFYTHALKPHDYGEIEIIATTISLIIPIISGNIVDAIFRFNLQENNTIENQKKILNSSLFVIFISFLVIFGISPILLKFTIFTKYLSLFQLGVLFELIFQILKAILKSRQRITLFALSDVIFSLIFSGLSVYLILYKNLSVKGYFLAYTISLFLTVIFLFVKIDLFNQLSINYLSLKLLKDMFGYSIPLIPNIVFMFIINSSQRYILATISGLSIVGLFSVASKFSYAISIINGFFIQAWGISSIENYEKTKDMGIFHKVFQYYFFALGFVYLIFDLVIKHVFKYIVSMQFYESWKIISLLMLGIVFYGFGAYWGAAYIAYKKSTRILYTTLISAFVMITSSYLLVKHVGFVGIGVANCTTFFIFWVVRMFDIQRLIGDDQIIGYNKIICGVVMFIISTALTYFDSSSYIIIFSKCFCILLFVILFRENLLFIYYKLFTLIKQKQMV